MPRRAKLEAVLCVHSGVQICDRAVGVSYDCSVQKPDKEYDDTESVHQEIDEHLEISLTRHC